MGVPYENAASGTKARDEINKILRRFGCDQIGWMDDEQEHEVLLAFTHRGRSIQLKASAKGWAQMWLRQSPWTNRHRTSRMDYEQAALHQGHIAVNSILRDWLKGQVTAIECGILSFEAVFMPYMLTADGRPLIERIKDENLLPAPQEQKVVSMRGRRRNKPVDPRRAVGFLEDVLALVGFFRLLGCAPAAPPRYSVSSAT